MADGVKYGIRHHDANGDELFCIHGINRLVSPTTLTLPHPHVRDMRKINQCQRSNDTVDGP